MTVRARLLRLRHDLGNLAQGLGSSVLTEMVAEVDAVLAETPREERWIPVAEALPEERMDVIYAYACDGEILRACGHRGGRSWWDDDRSDHLDADEVVTHWRPFPPLPTPEP